MRMLKQTFAASLLLVALLMSLTIKGSARQQQDRSEKPPADSNLPAKTSGESPKISAPTAASTNAAEAPLTPREQQLLERVEKLEQRLAQLEAQMVTATTKAAPPASIITEAAEREARVAASVPVSDAKTAGAASQPGQPVQPATPAVVTGGAPQTDAATAFWRDTTFHVTIDGYYGYNFNRPAGRVNLLRAYDVSHNSFSLNQAAIVIEQTPDVERGRRFGGRLDLQYGQATETVQGNAANELRPQAYRPIWQAYGTYVVPVGDGLTVDFGKFAGSLGYETNYTKDNFNYSRAYFFNFLPFYHFGLRAKYPVNDKLTVMYHLVNGTQQSEDFNRFKSQHLALILTPAKSLTWQVNYYAGREQRDVVANLNPTFPALPTQPGLPTEIIVPSPKGRFHVLDTYATWNVTDKLTLAGEADYVINRIEEFSAPSRVVGGAAYLRYQVAPKFALAARGEYLSDRGGLFSGVTQVLKETTLTADFKLAEGFLWRGEWRRDFSNQPFFLTETPGFLKRDQQTATVGLVWWFGSK